MNELVSCYLDKCKRENKEVEEKFNSYNTAKKNLVKLYYMEKISKEKFITIMTKISKYHFNSSYYRDFVKCIFINCYKKVATQLDIIIKNINYKKPKVYTVDDFIKIMIKRNKMNVIMPLVKKYESK